MNRGPSEVVSYCEVQSSLTTMSGDGRLSIMRYSTQFRRIILLSTCIGSPFTLRQACNGLFTRSRLELLNLFAFFVCLFVSELQCLVHRLSEKQVSAVVSAYPILVPRALRFIWSLRHLKKPLALGTRIRLPIPVSPTPSHTPSLPPPPPPQKKKKNHVIQNCKYIVLTRSITEK